MPLNKPEKIEEYVLWYLHKGPVLILDLIKKIQEIRKNTTKQAVYAAVRVLKKKDQILTYKGTAFLNLTWVNSMISYFDLARSNYVEGEEITRGDFINLEDGEKIKYYFNNSVKADMFWAHAFYILIEKIEEKYPIFVYHPHEWFLVARNESEIRWLKNSIKNKNPLLLISGGDTFLDKYVRKYFNNSLLRYHANEKLLFGGKNNYYLNILGDFIIEFWLDKEMSNKIESFYKKTKSWHKNIPTELKEITDSDTHIRIIISKNSKKAEKLKKTFKKFFIIK